MNETQGTTMGERYFQARSMTRVGDAKPYSWVWDGERLFSVLENGSQTPSQRSSPAVLMDERKDVFECDALGNPLAEVKGEATVILAADSAMQYPEVIPGVTRWMFSDEKVKGTVLVTEQGLRRLLRLARLAMPLAMTIRLKDSPAADMWADDTTPVKLAEIANESSSIFCEDSLVISGLFVTPTGQVVVHPDDEIAAKGSAK